MKKIMRRVNPRVYTREYYLNDCSGYQEFQQSWGEELEPRFVEIIDKIPVKKGDLVLDIGCGRGELVLWATQRGARAVGVDYSAVAIKLANSARCRWPKKNRKATKFKQMDAKQLKFPDQSFNLIIMSEVWEHIYPEEQEIALKEMKRVLKKTGQIFIHTAPSRWFNDYTYRFWCYPMSSLMVGVCNLFKKNDNYPNLAPWSQIRSDSHQLMHVAEPDYFSMKKLFNKMQLKGSIKSTNVTVLKPELSWKDKLFNALVYLHPLGTKFPFNVLWGNDFFVLLQKS
ncbi:class I SAM-dependent methyltransferase [Patescibacteria group bacterium]|nr:class I SAM-dependent methyltransferase [Patescibacteria group bacterium]MBU1885778.1 class I SAM-dependent methyltransferase [Patescibacteria group bacterium]